jgi:hypothetical protein
MTIFKNLFNKHKCKWHVIAFDHGYQTTFSDSATREKHNLTFSRCECGNRKMTGNEFGSASRHSSITKSMHRWVEMNILQLTDESSIFNMDYTCVRPATSTDVGTWYFRPLTGIEKLIKQLKQDAEFIALSEANQLVEDAFNEFETVVKLHENIDTK